MSNIESPFVGRLAPSPTGAQHLGNARTFLLAWLIARHQSGELVLRIEDLETPRIKTWASQQAIDDLKWLGLDWDRSPIDNPSIPLIQSERISRYQEILDQLISSEQAYPCTCSRSDIESMAGAPHEVLQNDNPLNFISTDIGTVYPGTCSHRRSIDAITLIKENRSFAWRFRMPTKSIGWSDSYFGPQSLENPSKSLGDFVIARMNKTPAYQLAVVVDDHDMKITQVTRGSDLLVSTYRQIALYDQLGWKHPVFFHAPLVVGLDGRRLAKRHGDTRLSTLRAAKIAPEVLIGFLAFRSGLLQKYEPISARQLLHRSSVLLDDLKSILPREPLCFDSNDAVNLFQKLQSQVV